MAEPLRLLLLEACLDAAETILRELRLGGYAPIWERIDTREGLHAALGEPGWDLVIVARTPPGLDVLDAPALVRQREPNLPVIIVSDDGRPEAAVAAMRAGANDYVTTDNLTRLAPSVAGAMRDMGERRARCQAEPAAQFQDRLLDAVNLAMGAPIILYVADAEGTITLSTGAGLSLFGVAPGAQVGRPLVEVFDRVPGMVEQIQRAYRGETTTTIVEYRGRVLEAHWWASCDGTGRVSGVSGMAVDLTERREAEARLRDNEARYRALIEHSFDGIVLVDAEGRARYVSPSMRQILGYADEGDLLSSALFDVVHPDDAPAAVAVLADLLQRPGGNGYIAYRLRHRDGSYRWVEVRATNLLAEPSVEAVVLNIRDITERRQADDLRRRLAAIVESSVDAIFSISLDGRIESWNEGAAHLFGYSREEAVGAPLALLAPPEQREEQQRLRVAAREGIIEVVDHEAVRRHRDGHLLDVAITRSPLLDQTGRLVGLSIVVRDITAQKRAFEDEQRARVAAEELAQIRAEREQEARALGEIGAALAHELDPERLYLLILEHAARFLPCDYAHMRLYQDGWVVVAATWGETTAAVGARLFPLIDAEGRWMPIARDAVVRVDDTAQIPYWAAVPPYTGARRAGSSLIVPVAIDGEPVGSLTINSRRTHTYTDHHLRLAVAFGDQLTLALRNARLYAREQERARAAEELVRVRNDFVSAVSHELRTPLTAVVGYGELLQARWPLLTEERRRAWLDRIVSAANRQQHLVNDLLTISRVESGTLVLSSADTPLRPRVEQAAMEVQGIYLGQRIDLDGPADIVVFADPYRIVQIVAQLLDNAAKYSPEGSPVTVTWHVEGEAAIVRVRDHGMGVAEAERGQLFTRFGRIPGSRIRAGRVGTGLGLYLGRQLACAMGGDLDLERTGSDGSTFRLRLPLAPPAG